MRPLAPDLEALLVEAIRARKRMWRVGGLGMIAMMGVLGALAFFVGEPPDTLGPAALAGIGAAVGALALVPSLGDPRRAEIFTTLRERADAIVWAYVLVEPNQASSWVMLGLDDGARARTPAVMGHEQALLRWLAAHAPRATVGFSPELDARFRASPASLRR